MHSCRKFWLVLNKTVGMVELLGSLVKRAVKMLELGCFKTCLVKMLEFPRFFVNHTVKLLELLDFCEPYGQSAGNSC